MTAPKQQISESVKLSGLDLIVKYAALLSWFVYGAGLTKISGSLHTLSVPTEPSIYALPTVLSYGAYSVLDILKTAAIPIVFLKLCEKQTPRQLWRYLGWTMPAGLFVQQNYQVLSSIGPIQTRVYYALYFLAATYILVYGFNNTETRELSVVTQVLVGALLFYLVAEGAGFRGDLEAYEVMNNPPTVQLLLAPEAVSGANKLGIPFSSEPGLTVPLNVVAFSERMFYVRIPLRLDASQVQNATRLDIKQQTTVAIPRDKVIMASAYREPPAR
jgi:hypothetical protein